MSARVSIASNRKGDFDVKQFAGSALSIVCAICMSAPVGAETYYVASAGNDENPGTAEKPFRTLNRGVKPLKPGDTLVVREGVYRESLRDNIPAGTSWDAPVTPPRKQKSWIDAIVVSRRYVGQAVPPAGTKRVKE
jgi:hypothetical protein